MALKNVSVDDIISAMEENGYIHCRGNWFKAKYDEDKYSHDVNNNGHEEAPITEACILGQVALNLGVDTGDLQDQLNTLQIVPNMFLKRQGYTKNNGYETVGIGSAAISYNDGTLLSYNKISAKVREWLEPFRGRTLRMAEKKYIARKKVNKS